MIGRRVLVVENDYFAAMDLERVLQIAEAVVLGPASSVSWALDLLEREAPPDVALLNVNLGEDMVYPVADALTTRGVPFLFVTGYDRVTLPKRYATVRRLQKPAESQAILREVANILTTAA